MTREPAGVLAACDPRGVATLTLDRPDRGNAYDRRMLGLLAAGIARFSADPAVRVLVLRGNGRHFGVGGDILGDPRAIAERSDEGPLMPAVCLALDTCPKPTVALVHGACMGGAFALAACCDVLLAADDAVFAVPELRLGFSPTSYLPFFERALEARALRRLLITGERIGAAEALRLGVAHRLCAVAEMEAALAALVGEVMLSAPQAAAVAKADLRRLAGLAPTAALIESLHDEFRRGFEAAEGREGRAAFRDKRRPAWAPKGE